MPLYLPPSMKFERLTDSLPARLLRSTLSFRPFQSKGPRPRVMQMGPNELFLDILSYFPVGDYLDCYYRAQISPLLRPTLRIPRVYLERSRILVALTSTCWDMRLRLLPWLWGRVQAYIVLGSYTTSASRVGQSLLMQCRLLLKSPSLAAHVHVLSVDLVFQKPEIQSRLSSFVRCLRALPNLHTLEIVYYLGGKNSTAIKRAFLSVRLPNVLTLTVYSGAESVIKACPNVRAVTLICGGFVIPDSAVDLLADMRHTIRRVAIIHGNPRGVAKLAERFPTLEELSLAEPSARHLRAITGFSSLRTLELVLLPSRRTGADPREMWTDQVQAAVDVLRTIPGNSPILIRLRKVDNTYLVSSPWWEMEEIWV
ncbi:hypothetical protein BDM02DRAFT_1432761 [Thelephora ganbajun]|uniref:Uncharacterized protein n=1 Tax=Thelephora ganbajun TaxID=370292 RepID=A0ACB6ZLJ5_THEGA|nr:hypothetical protein BDM02DRAFT_1432761 [Thelephora ganbajun]